MWIEIPLAHWETIGTDKFCIGRDPDVPRSGTYKLSLSKFSPQVAQAICKQLDGNERSAGHNPSSKIDLLTAVVVAGAKSYEVTVKTKDFADYLDSHGLKEPITAAKGGRHQKEGWRDLSSYMAAYMAAHQRDRPQDHFTAENSAQEIFLLAKANNVPDLPSAQSIKLQVSKTMNLLQEPQFNMKKQPIE